MFARPTHAAGSAHLGPFGFTLLVTLLLPAALLRAVPADPGSAAPLADRVPANAILYMGWHGADGLAPAYAESRLKGVIDTTDYNQLFEPFLPRVIERIEKEDKDAANAIRTVLKIGKPMWKHPSAFFFSGIDWNGDKDMPIPHLAFLCQAGDDAADLEKELTQAVAEGLKQIPAPLPIEIKVVRLDDVVAIVAGDQKILSAKAINSLGTEEAFKAALSRVHKDPVALGYVNFQGLRHLIDAGVEKQGDAEAKTVWPKVRQASGFEGLGSAVWACGFDGKDWVDQAFVAAPAPRKGLLRLMDDKPITDEAIQLIPRTATLAGVARCDAAQCLDVLREFVGNVDPDARQQLDAALKQASETAGVNLEQDLLKGLGDQWVYYTDPHTGGRGVMGLVLVNRLRDAAKAEQALTGLEKFASSLLAEQTKDQPVKISFLTSKSGDLTLHYLGFPLITPTWTIHDGNLYVAFFPQVVVSATDQVAGKSKSVLENADFVALRARMDVENPTGFQFMDLPRTAPDAYPQWLMLSRVSGFGDLFGVPSPAMLAPPLSRLLPQLTAAGSVTWVDNDGWHAKAISPFPGSTALSTDPFGGMMGMQPLAYGIAAPMQFRKAAEAPEPRPPAAVEEKIEAPKPPPEK